MSGYTPMIQQYLSIKEQAQDAFLFFRLGDFYEMFFDDAVLASRVLEITLTGRDGGGKERIPMCGVPYHSAEGYISRLIEKGYKVAICEQVEDPAAAKGVVRREIVRVITPGTVMETKSLEGKANNFIAGVAEEGGSHALAVCDLSTGELYATSFPASVQMLADELNVYHPAEVVGEAALLEALQELAQGWERPLLLTEREPMDQALLEGKYGQEQLSKLAPARVRAVSVLTGYLNETQKRSLGHVSVIRGYEPNQYMVLDPFTRRNLELTETVHERRKKGSLLWLLDRTETAMGARLLRRWIDKPLLSQHSIEERLEAVDKLYHDFMLREELRGDLKEIYDLERLVGRVAFGSANARDLNALKLSLQRVPGIAERCQASASGTLSALVAGLDDCADLAAMIETVLVEDPPVSVREGGLIRQGYDDYLDQLREASTGGKRWLAELEKREREATGIRTLKIGYNKVFGYYLEVTKANLSQLPEGRYERKQTLANAERFVTPELKEKERLILEAEEKMVDLEYERFAELRDHLASHLSRLQRLAEVIAAIDVYQSLAAISAEQRFCRPVISSGYGLQIEGGRHPVVEAVMGSTPFIANDTSLGDEQPMLLITGPNMAGKSTYMRQVALICIMAQIGCFVPADAATIPLTDRIFTRIGAADDLIGGQSTFMVEMKDIQIMTEQATRHSLVIIDELGRGTSTGEGMAIAQAVIEFVHHQIGCKALVSTHFHELAHLEDSLPGLSNACMAVQESADQVTFLRKLVPGAASTSYGIYCAQLAGLPGIIIDRAYALLHSGEQHGGGLAERGGSVPSANAAQYVATTPADVASGAGMSNAAVDVARRGEPSAAAADTGLPAAPSGGMKPGEGAGNATAASDAASGDVSSTAGADSGSAASKAVAPDTAIRESAAHQSLSPLYAAEVAAAGEVVQLSLFAATEPSAADKPRKPTKSDKVAEELRKLDLFNMTPLQAMQWISEMKQKLAE
ncbi:DNA mismatch repair protein MutS [Paenibacillus sp. SYP-B4298]|uniref:DNA mismatch repair protein MutS n=1 Tax=Paenibacillus sp. SYP-B4298 TaxID=2996034 RepID=UPI0022DE3F3E|nr:DNA mismatch repair protein MutS [Paenibacillus sp. SYP-B4298]